MNTPVIAYHFCGATLRDGRPIPADGEWLIHDGPVVMCKSGLHASRHPFDALQYAPGATLCKVECDDIVDEQDDKLVCRRRRIITRIDATSLLWTASRLYALSALHLWAVPPVVREYLETGREDLMDAAWDAARDVAWDATRAATREAARDVAKAARAAAWAATNASARAAAMTSAWDAANASVREAARAAAWAATEALERDATREAAWAATWYASMQRHRDIFAELVEAAFA